MRTFHSDKQLILEDKEPCLEKIEQEDREEKVCQCCVDHVDTIDYKNIAALRRFVSEKSRILPRRVTGTCAKHQRKINLAIKRARAIALLPFSAD